MRYRLRMPQQVKKHASISDFNNNEIPQHVAIVMDGNGRWARRRGLPRTAGHHAGMEALKNIVRAACELGIKVLTVYAFSTENWHRPSGEVEFLMRLPNEYLKSELSELTANNIQLRISGDIDRLPAHTREAVEKALAQTAANNGMVLNFALNYGSRTEIVKAVKEIAAKAAKGQLDVAEIDEKTVERHLYTEGLPDPDLLIRPSGERRLSNFLLWQIAYTELWFSNIYWPDFTRKHLLRAIADYQKRDRRYGGIKL